MRFMVIVKSDANSEAGKLPDEKMLIEMGKLNEEMIKAGVMLAGEGLQPSSKGAKVRFDKDKRTVIDGPFAEAREMIGGFWILKVASKAEVIEWVKKVPFDSGEIEIRQISEASDFEAAVNTAAGKATLDAEEKFRVQQGQK
jgi:hypothetical protein